MIEISTYIRNIELQNPDSKLKEIDFFNVSDTAAMIKNSAWFQNEDELMYIPGYISIKYYGEELLGLRYWDNIFWIWTSFGEDYKECRIKSLSIFSLLFSEQPVRLTFEKKKNNNYSILIFEKNIKVKEQVLISDRLVENLLLAGVQFFESIKKQSSIDLSEHIQPFKQQLKNI